MDGPARWEINEVPTAVITKPLMMFSLARWAGEECALHFYSPDIVRNTRNESKPFQLSAHTRVLKRARRTFSTAPLFRVVSKKRELTSKNSSLSFNNTSWHVFVNSLFPTRVSTDATHLTVFRVWSWSWVTLWSVACSPSVHVRFLQVLCISPTYQKEMVVEMTCSETCSSWLRVSQFVVW